MRAAAFACLLAAASGLAPGQQATSNSDLTRAVEEFKVQSRALGLRADSPVKARSTTSLAHSFHGRLFHNFRNDIFDAVPHEIVQRDETKSILRRNQFGFNVSGPVIFPHIYNGEHKTFFSLSYEGVRERIGRSALRTVPIDEERAGDYSHVVDYSGNPLMIYDPATTKPNPNYDPNQPVSTDNLEYLRDPFPGSRMPANRLDPVAQKMLTYYPKPNTDAGPFFRNNYFIVSPETNQADGMIAKIDHNFLEKHRLNTSISWTNGFGGAARLFDTLADSGPTDRTYQNRRVAMEHVYTQSPQSVNTASIEASSDISENTTPGENMPQELGLSGVPGDVFPWVRLGPYISMGRPSPANRNVRNTFVFTDAHSLRRGKHNLRGVAQFIRYQVNTYMPQFPSSTWNFSEGLTSLPGIVNTGHSFASFLLGLSDSAQLSQVPQPSYFRGSLGTISAQDTWEARPDFTVSFGVSLLVQTPRVEKYGRQSTIDPTALNPANGLPGALVSNRDSYQPVRVRPQPNLSLSWNPRGDRKSVLRASYGMSFQSIPIYNGQWGTQGFNGYRTWYSLNSQLQPAATLASGLSGIKPLPDLRGEAANDTRADLVEPSGRMPRYQSIGASGERELPRGMVLSTGLGVSWGKDLLVSNGSVNPNAIQPVNLVYRDQLNDEFFNRSLRPYPQYLGFDVYSSWPHGRYRREAGWARVEKRTAQGLTLNAYYEFSRQYDDYSGPYGTQDFFNSRNEWSLTPWNNPHRVSLTFMYELPIGLNKPYLSAADWRRYLTTGWAVSGITSVASGTPLALHAQFNNTGGVLQTVHVDSVPGVDPRVSNQGPDLWFSPDAFSQPADFAMGDMSRTHPFLHNPMSQNHDLSLSKRFAIDPERTLEFNASAFNFMNQANWNEPDTMIGPVSSPNANAGKIIGSRGGRVIQVGLRLSF